jgi:hypothetical protein
MGLRGESSRPWADAPLPQTRCQTFANAAGLAGGGLVAMGRFAIGVMAGGDAPNPRYFRRRCVRQHDVTHHVSGLIQDLVVVAAVSCGFENGA